MKICVIGGGSTYTPELVDGLLRRRDRLPIEELHLVDIDEARLAVLGPLAERMATAAGAHWKVSWGSDRVAGIRDAMFVISQMRVGGMAARERDEQLGREFGLIGQETVGVGGFANALRTIPVALDIARDIEEHAPGAILLNFTNPAGLVTEALCRHSNVTTIGLCNVPWSFSQWFARGLGVDAGELDLDYVGLNHLSWVRAVRTPDGVDHVGTLVDGMAGHAERHPPSPDGEPGWTGDIVRLIDAIPNYYLLYYFETAAWELHQATHPTRASEVVAIEHALLEQYRDPGLTTKPKELEQRGGAYYSETAAALMADIASDANTVHVVNVRNDGAIPGLADDVVVEVPARVTRAGAHAIPTAPLRADVDALVRTVKDFELLTVRAAVDGDTDAARLALLTNPLGPGASAVSAVWQRLQDVHAGYLGRLERA
ncbi:MAG TPA: 6-phospho-beta-glucosidase [Acidimicrobiia bacterium]